MPKTAYSYVRFSRPEQVKGDSFRRQAEQSAEYVKKRGWVIDDSLQLRDLGISAFKGKNVRQGALSAFIRAVESGRVVRGSVLIVESLDRISRDEIGNALTLFLDLLRHGIEIVTIEPERHYTKASVNDIASILEPIVYMSRAHEESKSKSERLQKAWKNKRDHVKDKKLTGQIPAWLTLSEDKKTFSVKPEAAAVLRRIFQLAIDGRGIIAITKILNDEQVPNIGRADEWHKSYVTKLLKNRAVIGEYQPHVGHAGADRKPIGDPIPTYFPSVIKESVFYRAQQAMTARRNKAGRESTKTVNIFKGMLRDARDGGSLILANKGSKSGPALVSHKAQRGIKGSAYIGLPYNLFERGVLLYLADLNFADLQPSVPQADTVKESLDECDGRKLDIDNRLSILKKKLATDSNIEALIEVVTTLERERETLTARIKELRSELSLSDDRNPLLDIVDIQNRLKECDPAEAIAMRFKLRSIIARTVKDIWVLIFVVADRRIAEIQINFTNGATRNLTHAPYLAAAEKSLGVAARKRLAKKAIEVGNALYEGDHHFVNVIDLRKFRTLSEKRRAALAPLPVRRNVVR